MISANRIVITGATSATALWIARGFALAGWRVDALCSKNEADYIGQRKERLRWLHEFSTVHFGLLDVDEKIKWIKTHPPDVFIFHHHVMENFRSPLYDEAEAVSVGTKKADRLIAGLNAAQCRGLIYSSSYFELEDETLHTSYTCSKVKVGDLLKKTSLELALPFSRIYVPDVYGPLENEDRFIPSLIKARRSNGTFELKNPEQSGNHMAMHDLADIYIQAGRDILRGRARDICPQGWVGRQRDWLKIVSGSLLKPLGLEPGEKESVLGDKLNWQPYINFEMDKNPWRGL